MNDLIGKKNCNILQQLIKKVDCHSLREFSLKIKVSELQLLRLQNGLLPKMSVETLIKIALGLNISLNELIALFSVNEDLEETIAQNQSISQDYKNLQQKYSQQEQELTQKFQLSSLETLESLLLQLPTVVKAVNNNPDLPAIRLLPLLNPIQQLLKSWGIEEIGSVGAEIPYNPTEHQLMEGTANLGDLVEVRYIGYRQGDLLLYRAKVSSLTETNQLEQKS